jgi:3-oxoacyl-[acyl-carrier protein] reductase
MTTLLKKTALVGGGSDGIGKATAIALAAQGANVVLMARNAQKLATAIEDLDHSQGQTHRFLVADFAQPTQVREVLAAYLADNFAPIDILINNTGGPAGGAAHTAAVDAFRAAFDMHLVVNQELTQFVLPNMKAKGYGRIINIISTSVKQPLPNLGVSNTIRGAVASWAKTVSNEVAAWGITVNNVLPGATATGRLDSIIANKAAKTGQSISEVAQEMLQEIPAARFAQPEEIAFAVAFLASPQAAYINGINLPVDGGRTKSL